VPGHHALSGVGPHTCYKAVHHAISSDVLQVITSNTSVHALHPTLQGAIAEPVYTHSPTASNFFPTRAHYESSGCSCACDIITDNPKMHPSHMAMQKPVACVPGDQPHDRQYLCQELNLIQRRDTSRCRCIQNPAQNQHQSLQGHTAKTAIGTALPTSVAVERHRRQEHSPSTGLCGILVSMVLICICQMKCL
jgi:hypothetical protein